MTSRFEPHATCPICESPASVDRPDLPHLQATCGACGWHFTARIPGVADEPLACAHCCAVPEVVKASPPIPLQVWEASCGCDHERDGETPVAWGHTAADAMESWNEKQEAANDC